LWQNAFAEHGRASCALIICQGNDVGCFPVVEHTRNVEPDGPVAVVEYGRFVGAQLYVFYLFVQDSGEETAERCVRFFRFVCKQCFEDFVLAGIQGALVKS